MMIRWTRAVAAVAVAMMAVAGTQGCIDTPGDDESTALTEMPMEIGVDEEVPVCAPLPPKVLTYNVKYESKLFINGATCNVPPGFLPAGNAGAWATWKAFCLGTDAAFQENPPSPNPFPGGINGDLDARIYGASHAMWQCAPNSNKPISGSIVAGLAIGGKEPGGFQGVAHPVKVRDQIFPQGLFGMVTSGRPDPRVEGGFQLIRPRATPDIWNKLTGDITCAPLSTTINSTLTSTKFPSDKLWRTNKPNGAVALLHTHGQGGLFQLWSLPPVPAP